MRGRYGRRKKKREKSLGFTSLMSKGIEQSLGLHQLLWRLKLLNPPLLQNQNLVRIHHSLDSMSNRQNRPVLELGSDRLLDQLVRLHIHRRRSLIQDQDLGLAE